MYQYIKYHEVRKATKGHPGSSDLESGKGTLAIGSTSAHSALSRSKTDIMSEMRRLQDELADVDKTDKHSL